MTTARNKRTAERAQRAEHVNALIKIIGSHGRRFFYSPQFDRFAHVELRQGRVYFVDDYSDRAIYTHATGFVSHWRGFSHGGTLRDLVERLRDYIIDGQPLPIGVIGRYLVGTNPASNVWGYSRDAIIATRQEAAKLPIFGAAA